MRSIFKPVGRPYLSAVQRSRIAPLAQTGGVDDGTFIVAFDDPDASEYILTFDDLDGTEYILTMEAA